MRNHFAVAALVGVLLGTLGVLVSTGWAARPGEEGEPGSTPEQLVAKALEAEAAGDLAHREDLLREALGLDSQCPAAHWLLAHVYVHGEWITVEEAARRARADERLAEYRRLRETHAGTPAGELALARFCRDHDLPAEAKVHWLHVVQLQPNHEEALRSLGARWHGGRLRLPEEVERADQRRAEARQSRGERDRAFKRWEKHWTPRVQRWLRMARKSAPGLARRIDDDLRVVDKLGSTPTPMIALDRTMRKLCDGHDEREVAVYRDVSLKLVGVLDATPPSSPRPAHQALGRPSGEDRSSVSRALLSSAGLADYAVSHPVDDVRKAAAEALGKRPMPTYVPLLLARLATPMEAAFSVVSYGDGHVSLYHAFSREGLDADYYETTSQTRYVQGTPSFDVPPASPDVPDWARDVDVNDTVTEYRDGELFYEHSLKDYVDRTMASDARYNAISEGIRQTRSMATRAAASAASEAARRRALAGATVAQDQVRRANLAIEQRNRRVFEALRRATGVDAGEKATDWWAWWRHWWHEHYELDGAHDAPSTEEIGHKPVYHAHYWSNTYAQMPSTSGSGGPVRQSLPASRPPSVVNSCFARGTKVWTVTGPAPIEEIRVGDRVLSQNTMTGELAYKPVLQTTIRRPSPMVKISMSPDPLETTRGHMVFTAGRGWVMAKDLRDGELLHTAGGAVRIDRVEQTGPPGPWYEQVDEDPDAAFGYGSAYNLVVDGFHTFFVGTARVLVHDNTLFGRPYAAVPGLPAY